MFSYRYISAETLETSVVNLRNWKILLHIWWKATLIGGKKSDLRWFFRAAWRRAFTWSASKCLWDERRRPI